MLLMLFLAVASPCFGYNGDSLHIPDVSRTNCSKDEMLSCAYPTAVEQIRFATKQEDLDVNCPHLHDGLRCIDDYTRQCLTPEQRSHFNKLIAGTSMVLQEVCTTGPYQEEFLMLAPCMNNVTKEYKACVNKYEIQLQKLNALDFKSPGARKELHKICGDLNEYLDCSENIVREICGEDAARFVAGFLDRMANSLLRRHCAPPSLSASTVVSATLALLLGSTLSSSLW